MPGLETTKPLSDLALAWPSILGHCLYMSVKEMVIEKLKELPDDASPEEIQEKIAFILGIREAIASMDRGQGISKARVKGMISGWAGK